MRKNVVKVFGVSVLLGCTCILGGCGSKGGQSPSMSEDDKQEKMKIVKVVIDAIKESKKMVDSDASFSYTSKRGEEVTVKDVSTMEEIANRKTNNQYIGTKDFENLKEEMIFTNVANTKMDAENKEVKETSFIKDGRLVTLSEKDTGLYVTWCNPIADSITISAANDISSVMLQELEEDWDYWLTALQDDIISLDDKGYVFQLNMKENDGIVSITFDNGYKKGETPWNKTTTLTIKDGMLVGCEYLEQQEGKEESYSNRLMPDWIQHHSIYNQNLFSSAEDIEKLVGIEQIYRSYQKSYSFTLTDINAASYDVDYSLYNNAKAGVYDSSYTECRGW